jgi:RNA polymerase sigma factor (sigma-70 family)
MEHSFRARVRAGDADAFGALFDDHARAIYRYAYRLSGEAATSEDIVAQTFLEAWRLRASVLPEGGSLQPWLYGIATNVLRNSRRTVRRYRAVLERLPAPEPTPDIADEPVRRAGDHEELAAARTALKALRPLEREVVALCIWSGFSYAEAAEALGVPVGTVRSRLSRAKARLRSLAQKELRALRAAVELQGAGGQVEGVSTSRVRPSEERER